MANRIATSLLCLLLSAGARAQHGEMPADARATPETVNLYRNLRKITSRGFLFGHQDDLAYGVHWKYEPGRSDVKDVCGDYPALYGWDLSGLESGKDRNIDSVPFDKVQRFVCEAYARGGVNTFTWHVSSPLGEGKTAWDTSRGTVATILPGGAHHALYTEWLDKLVVFFGSLKGPKGEPIPVLFRPFHEHSGSWFWWGAKECSPEEYKALWRFTRHYLNVEKGLHNILWVFNTGTNFGSQTAYLERYPGNDAVDVVSFDAYQYSDAASFQRELGAGLRILDSAAAATGKVEALAETGYEQVPDAGWWTSVLETAIGSHPISYVLVWRNHGWNASMNPPHMHYYAPYEGQVSAADFKKFYALDNTLFEQDVEKIGMYQ